MSADDVDDMDDVDDVDDPEDTERRQVVVVGSGFGGAVTACRLAQAGCDVLVLERGRWYHGDFPRDAGDDWLWREQGGPFDVRLLGDVNVVTAAGVGGGSLLYSNVHLRMPPDGFGGRWPTEWSREVLDPYYDLVAAMLDLRRADEKRSQKYWRLPSRSGLLRDAAGLLGAGAEVFCPPLAVDFGDPRIRRINRFGAEQCGCRHCGKCSVGCNFGAKNSLDKNYLPLAVLHGAVVRDRCEVTAVACEPGGGYRITYRDDVTHLSDVDVVADVLVLAAGSIGTTELLIEHRDQLGELSPRLGEHYSANGDYVTAAVGIEKEWNPTRGPAITTAVLSDDDETWFLVQDGGFPAVSVLDPETGVRPDEDDRATPVRDLVIQPAHVAILLAMGRDSAGGRMRLRRRGDGVRIDWPSRDSAALYEAERDYLGDIGYALEEVGEIDPGRITDIPVSVHSLGGAVMADDPEHGVVKPTGEVFGADGLYVMDGAAIPTATGVNPSHTIAAVAERNAERLARLLTGQDEWVAPERRTAPPYPDPLPAS